jgi:PKD repeat protein
MKRALALAIVGLACGKSQAPVHDAATERPAVEVAPHNSDGPPTLAVDFSVEGCPSFDSESVSCTGTVPLALRFVPMVTAPVLYYIWDFGDKTSSDPTTPSHVYTVPGVYSVSVVASGADGIVRKTHLDFVAAEAKALGEPCDLDAQCLEGLFCLCPAGACDYGPPRGTCTAHCQAGACPDDQICVDLATTAANSLTEPWQASLCLRGCDTDADCNGGLHCRSLPPGAGSTWVKACFSELPSNLGESCVDASGAMRDNLCVRGVCASLGAKGMCTLACSSETCPPGSDCAILGDGRKLCLRPCGNGFACDQDPLLQCLPPGSGDLGYRLADASATTSTYCAPKRCSSDDDCLPFGQCDGDSERSHCVARKK